MPYTTVRACHGGPTTGSPCAVPRLHAFPSRTRTEAHRSPHSVPWSAAPKSPPIRSLPPGARRLHKWMSAFSSRVCASSTSPCPATGRPANPARAARRRHWSQPRRTQGPAGRITLLRRPPPSRAPTSAHRSAHLSHPAATSPEQSLPRPARDGAAEPRRRAPLRSNFDPKPAQGKPRTIFHPAGSSPEFLSKAPATMPKDPIAIGDFFLRVNPQSRGIFVSSLIFLGAFVKSCNFNSICDLLNLVNFVENRRQIRKMQTQFCWMSGEKYYNFCYYCLSCFLIVFA
jgi:hypothetical protein